MWLEPSEERAIFLGKYTTHICGICGGSGKEWVDDQEGESIGRFAPPKEIQEKFPDRFYQDSCGECLGIGGYIEFENVD